MSATVDGVDGFAASLEDAAADLGTLTAGHDAAGRLIMTMSAQLVPRRTGRLAGSGRLVAGPDGVTVTWGSASVPYAPVINFGWPARNIRAQPFATSPLERGRDQITAAYAAAAADVLATVHT